MTQRHTLTRYSLRSAIGLATALLATTPAHAAQKNIGVTSFDTISIQGDFIVTVTEGTGASVQANGDTQALEALDVVVNSRRMLVIREKRPDDKPRGATKAKRKPVELIIRASGLSGVTMLGNGQINVSGVRKPDVYFAMRGNGVLTADKVDTRSIKLSLDGAGSLIVSGKTQALNVVMSGAGSLDTRGLAASDLTVNASGNGMGNLVASRCAEIHSQGLGTVTVTGRAACKVENSGLGDVYCGPADKAPTSNEGVVVSEEI